MDNYLSNQMLKVSLNDDTSSINSLFAENIVNIFDFLSEEELLCARNVCVYWKDISTISKLWRSSAARGEQLGKLQPLWLGLVQDVQDQLATLRAQLIETYAGSEPHIRQQIREKSETKFAEAVRRLNKDIVLQLLLNLVASYKEVFTQDSTSTRAAYIRHQKSKTELLRQIVTVQDLATLEEFEQYDNNPFVAGMDLRGSIKNATAEMLEILLQ